MSKPQASERSNPTVERIMLAARRCFGEDGYRGASMQRIAEAAGVSKSLLHYHFDSKEHLFLEVQLHTCRQIADQVRSLASAGTGSTGRFEVALAGVHDFFDRERAYASVILEFHTAARSSGAVQAGLDGFYEELIRLIAEVVEAVFDDDLDRLPLPPHKVARILRLCFGGLVLEIPLARTREARRELRETWMELNRRLVQTIFSDAGTPISLPSAGPSADPGPSG